MKCEKCELDFRSKHSLGIHKRYCSLTIIDQTSVIKDYCENLFSTRELAKKYSLSMNVIFKILGDKIRTSKEGLKITRKLHPENFKPSDETKQKIRNKQLLNLQNRTGQTPYERRNSGKMSYLEQWFYDKVIIENQLEKLYDIVNEHNESLYRIDFAFIGIKLGVELDGSFHSDRNDYDINRDKFLNEKGWIIYRIPYYKIKREEQNTIKDFLIFLGDIKTKNIKVYGEYVIKNKQLKIEKFNRKNEEKQLIKNKIIDDKINLVLNSDIDFSKFGWVQKVATLLNFEPQSINRWMKKHMLNFYNEKCYKKQKRNNIIE